jgi:hypothetical protein
VTGIGSIGGRRIQERRRWKKGRSKREERKRGGSTTCGRVPPDGSSNLFGAEGLFSPLISFFVDRNHFGRSIHKRRYTVYFSLLL